MHSWVTGNRNTEDAEGAEGTEEWLMAHSTGIVPLSMRWRRAADRGLRLCVFALTRLRRGARIRAGSALNTSSPLSPISFISSNVFRTQQTGRIRAGSNLKHSSAPSAISVPSVPARCVQRAVRSTITRQCTSGCSRKRRICAPGESRTSRRSISVLPATACRVRRWWTRPRISTNSTVYTPS